MASPYKASKWARDTSFEETADSFVYIYDRRSGDSSEIKLNISDSFEFDDFQEKLCKVRLRPLISNDHHFF